MAEHPVTRFRRLLRLLVARARRRPRLTLLSVLLLAIAVGAAGTLVALSRSPVVPAPIGPVAVYSATWTLPDLTRHAEAGDVAAITVPRSAAGDPPGRVPTAGRMPARPIQAPSHRFGLPTSRAARRPSSS